MSVGKRLILLLTILTMSVAQMNATTVTIKFGANQGTGYVTATSGSIGDDLSYSTHKGNSENTAPSVYDDGLRLYGKSSNKKEGGILRIYVKAGHDCTINSVEVTFSSGKLAYIKSALTYGETLTSCTTYTTSSSPVTISSIDDTSIHLSNGNGSTTQTKIQKVVIDYSCEGDEDECSPGDATSIKAGDVVLIYYPGATYEFGGYASSGTSYWGDVHSYTTTPDGYFPFTVEAGNGGTGYSFKNGTTYLAMDSEDKNKLVGSATKNNASSWTVSINGSKQATITNRQYTDYIIKYNTSSYRFSDYLSDAGSTALPKIYRYCDDVKYYVTYDGNGNTGGTVPTDATGYASGATVTVKGNTGSLVKTGYTFGGWNTNAAGTGTNYTAGSGTFSISSNTTLYAKWTANTISLTLNKNNSDASGSANGSASVKYDATSLTSISHATRTGYSIEGYYAEAGCTNKVLSNTGTLVNYTGYVVSSKWARTTTPTTLYAKWTVNNYNLTWNLGGGTTTSAGTGIESGVSVNTTTSVAYGTSLTAPTVTREGYTFSSWSPSVASTMPATATTYTAQWTPNVYSVTWKVNNTNYSAGGSSSVNHGSHVSTLPTAPDPGDYCGDVFIGWTTVENYVHNTSPLYTTASGFPNATGNQIFYAVFADYAP